MGLMKKTKKFVMWRNGGEKGEKLCAGRVDKSLGC
jgi:hypothetical protein